MSCSWTTCLSRAQVALKTLMVIHRLMRETEGTTFVQRLLEAGGGGAPPSYGTAGYGPGAVVPYTSGGPGGPTGYGSGGYGPTSGAAGCAGGIRACHAPVLPRKQAAKLPVSANAMLLRMRRGKRALSVTTAVKRQVQYGLNQGYGESLVKQ